MPMYDFVCDRCGQDVSLFLTYTQYDKGIPPCPHCGDSALRRRIGQVATATGDRERTRRLSDSVRGDNSDRALGRVMRNVAEQSGRDIKPEYKEVISRLEKGESRHAIDRDYK